MKLGSFVNRLQNQEFFRQTKKLFGDKYQQKILVEGGSRAMRMYSIPEMKEIFALTQPCKEGLFDEDEDGHVPAENSDSSDSSDDE